MKFIKTALPEVIIVEPKVWKDDRGHFFEAFHAEKYKEAGMPTVFVQDNFSYSSKGILRGLHTQIKKPQGKLVRAVRGEIFDVAVDVRKNSPNFAKWVGVTLSGDNFKALYVPPGFLHGFCVVSETADVEYKCTDLYDPADELGVIWNDPDIGVQWPVRDPILSPKDKVLLSFKEAMKKI